MNSEISLLCIEIDGVTQRIVLNFWLILGSEAVGDLDQFAPSASRKSKKKRRSDLIYSREVSDAKRL